MAHCGGMGASVRVAWTTVMSLMVSIVACEADHAGSNLEDAGDRGATSTEAGATRGEGAVATPGGPATADAASGTGVGDAPSADDERRPINALPDDGSTASGSADGGSSPATEASPGVAPDNLRVGDRVHPLSVEGAVLFSWYPHHAAGDQAESAYEIQVHRESSGAEVWDSGKVASSQQSYVAYAGAALAAGESYTWRVRTWDRSDAGSAWSADGAFDTALTNDARGWPSMSTPSRVSSGPLRPAPSGGRARTCRPTTSSSCT
jgi:hypothetical protein